MDSGEVGSRWLVGKVTVMDRGDDLVVYKYKLEVTDSSIEFHQDLGSHSPQTPLKWGLRSELPPKTVIR